MISAFSFDCFTLTFTVLALTLLVLLKKYIGGGVCRVTQDLTGKIVVITGGNTGIGKETAFALAKVNATIVLACRDAGRTLPVVEAIKQKTNNKNIEFMQLDLSDLRSIENFAAEFKKKYDKIHILINNAGVLIQYKKTTKDGFEAHFGTNYLGHFHLTNLLIDPIKKAAPSRVINVSSMVHANCKAINWEDVNSEKSYNNLGVYPQSKLANVIFTKELNRRLEKEGVKVVSLNPGTVLTDIVRHIEEGIVMRVLIKIAFPFLVYFFKTPEQGAQTTVYCALEDHEKLKGGMYYSDCKLKTESAYSCDEKNWSRLWELSEEIIAKALKKTN